MTAKRRGGWMQLGARGWFVMGALTCPLVACQGSSPDKPWGTVTTTPASATAAHPDLGEAPQLIEWAGAGDCLDQLRLLHVAAGQGRLDATEEPPFAVLLVTPTTSLEWIQAPVVPLFADLPLKSYEDRGAAAAAAPCLLLVEPARDLRAAYRVVDFEDVASTYQSGVRSEKNPDHDVAQERVREAKREARAGGPSILRVGDPMLDLVGILVGGVVSAFGHLGEDDLDDALSQLKETPRSRDRPVYRAYEFERSTVRAGKEAVIPVALNDLRRGRIWRAQLQQREMRQFAVLEGLDPRDRDYEQHRAGALSWQEFEQWQHQPPQLPLSALVAALVEPGGGAEPPQRGDSELIAAATSDLQVPDPASATPVGTVEAVSIPSIAAIEPGAGPDPGASHLDPERRADEPMLRRSRASTPRWSHEATGSRQIGTSSDRPAAGATLDPRVASVVRLAAGSRRGNGFYVKPRLVVTAADVVGTASVIDVTMSDGEKVLGLVVLSDPIRNLAVVHVPRAGTPTPFADDPYLGASQSVQVIQVAGDGRARVTSAAFGGGASTAEAAALSGHLEIKTDGGEAAVGAPVFSNDRVVGLIADQSAGPTRNLVPINDVADLLDSEALTTLH